MQLIINFSKKLFWTSFLLDVFNGSYINEHDVLYWIWYKKYILKHLKISLIVYPVDKVFQMCIFVALHALLICWIFNQFNTWYDMEWIKCDSKPNLNLLKPWKSTILYGVHIFGYRPISDFSIWKRLCGKQY